MRITYNKSLSEIFKPKSIQEINEDLHKLDMIKINNLIFECISHEKKDILKIFIELNFIDFTQIKYKGGWSFITHAACTNCLDILIDAGANVNTVDTFGWTALIRAAKWGCLDNVKLLINKGANINQRDNDGLTALTHAIEHKQDEVI